MKIGWFTRTDWIAAGLVLALVTIDLIWNFFVGLSGNPPLWDLMLIPASLLAFGGGFRWFRPIGGKPIFDTCLYCALLATTLLFGIRLSYLGASTGFPLRDHAFTAADLALGFHWQRWGEYVASHHWLMVLHIWTYVYAMWEPIIVAAALALFKPDRNAQMFVATFIAALMTIAVFTVFPSMGPAYDANVPTHIDQVMTSLRAHDGKPLEFIGIIQFPSFHTVCALLSIWSVRGIKWLFWPMAILNFVVLTAIPFCGDHYVVDIIGGAIIACAAAMASTPLLSITSVAHFQWPAGGRTNRPSHTPETGG